jgi:hypothetical protein
MRAQLQETLRAWAAWAASKRSPACGELRQPVTCWVNGPAIRIATVERAIKKPAVNVATRLPAAQNEGPLTHLRRSAEMNPDTWCQKNEPTSRL